MPMAGRTPSLPVVSAVVPCLDEEEAIGDVVRGLLASGVAEVIVVDGGSQDRTAGAAAEAGARVLLETRRGYGRALITGIGAVRSASTIVLFVDGDGSDRLEHVPRLVAPLLDGKVAFVHGSRTRGEREAGSLVASQLVAGATAGFLIRIVYGARFTDMSPFRAIRRDTLAELGMREETYGWNLEMLMRIAAGGISYVEIPVGQHRRRGGASKVSGNWRAAIRAAWTIARTFMKLAVQLRRHETGCAVRGP